VDELPKHLQQLVEAADLWKVDQDHDRVYAFCTTEPNPLVAPKHPKSMPVILLAEDQERRLMKR
jgi:putative SOS response-associated peptidase YedK